MEEQTQLIKSNTTNEEQISELQDEMFKHYHKIIHEYGDYNSKIMILGISPVNKHYNSDSNCVFAFDKSINQTSYSGGVLCKVFKELGIEIYDVFFDNIFKVPENKIINRDVHINYMKKIIEIMNPKIIICLGTTCFNLVDKFPMNITIKKIVHPAAILRNFYSQEEYLNTWKKLNLKSYVK